MVDRESHKTLHAILNDYLSGKIRAFEFDDQLESLHATDQAVHEIIFRAYFFYDDFIDHPVKLTRAQWNYFQRLRLILQSDAEIKVARIPNWTGFHTLWITGIILLAAVGLATGMATLFWFVDLSFGIRFALAARARATAMKNLPPAAFREDELYPFDSLSSMRDLFEMTPEFQKTPYPRAMDLTPLRTTFRLRMIFLPWLIFWPILALAGFLTVRVPKWSVVPPQV